MGDKERMMEEEKEGNFTMVHHCPPMYPLPEEIKKMDRSETVCRYCGVSYLIYHEFHQLNTRLAQLETELQELREAAQREKAQREALELSRLEWETALNLEVQRKAEERETSMKEELEEKRRDTERLLREDNDRRGREMEEDYEKISEEKEKKLRGELGDLEVERLRRQREELERRNEEREKVLSDALHKANTNLDELRKYLQQVEERLAVAASRKKEAEQLLKKETRQGEILRGVCVQQVKALRATLIVLLSSASELTDIRGFLSQLTGAWQAFKSQILQHSTQVLSVLKEELKHSSEELQKTTEAREKLTQQLMQQRRQSEEQLSQQQDSEKEHRGRILRLKDELEAKHERWLSCQQRCDTIQEQLSSWQQRQEETKRKYCAAEEEVARLREALEKDQQETRELRKERDILIDSHGRTLEKMEDDCRQQLASKLAATLGEQRTQSALQLREQMEEFRREVELEMTIDREKNRLLLLHYQRDSTQLQQKLKQREQELGGLKEELLKERRSREEERRTQVEQRRRREEETHQQLQLSQQQEALQLSKLKLTNERNAELLEEVALLQETVRRECQEREELTAALSAAQVELLGLRSPSSHQASTRSPPNPTERHAPPGNKHFHLQSQGRAPLTRSSTSPNTLRPSPARTDKGRGSTDGGGAGKSVESWNGGGLSGEEKQQEGTLPRLKASSTVREGKRKVPSVMWRKERQ
ncbi:leucine-, glutamate- and lysine-rich protein 1 isoform X1 [Hippoglossus hippoglossus]|uniref:leucine-, glutamate- and lysine-rich protein 1 isoform X1 n=1 Tax=Hippoglossus hippoglossus TaxID=8267 RepID=UPI00148C736C|nr:leucine-, glutamate- and lysine-rich protein 1 isoform X1 [Hippoglossus hippoglossus]